MKPSRCPIKTRCYRVPRGLGRPEAVKAAMRQAKRQGCRDFRGFSYNPKTGKACLT